MLKKLFIVLICILLLPTLNNKLNVEANENEVLELGIESKGCILIDVLTNKVLYEKNADAIQKFGAKAKMLIQPKIKAHIFLYFVIW